MLHLDEMRRERRLGLAEFDAEQIGTRPPDRRRPEMITEQQANQHHGQRPLVAERSGVG